MGPAAQNQIGMFFVDRINAHLVFLSQVSPTTRANMTDNLKFRLPKLAVDGCNWVTYRNYINWLMEMRGLGDHLTDATVTQSCNDATEITVLPLERLCALHSSSAHH